MKLKEIHIKNFRGIKNQKIESIEDALILIGKNNAGKSAFLAAIRTLFGDYIPQDKDIYYGCDEFKIDAILVCDEAYISDYFLDNKIGFLKIPSTSNNYKEVQDGTVFQDISFNDFKNQRSGISPDMLDDVTTRDIFEPIWIKAIKKKFGIDNNEFNVSLILKKGGKVEYAPKDMLSFLPAVAFIDDSRNFAEEEAGKSRTITANIFNTILRSELLENNDISCDNCNRTDCEINCINKIYSKAPQDLNVEELQKLINFKTKNASLSFTKSVSERFAKNYQSGFKVNIKATSNIDKSFSIMTKLYDPMLKTEIELSNVGAGVRSIYILSLLQSYQAVSAKHTIFIIEEPELYLHPQLQKLMAKTLSEISCDNQVIFTSHSPIMLREFSTSNIRKVKFDESNCYSTVEKTTIDDVLAEIGYSSQDILNTDFVIFVEGPDDKNIIELVLKRFYDVDLERISVIDTKSCNNIGFYATLRFLTKTTMSDDFIIIRDSDTKTETALKNDLINQLTNNVNKTFALKAVSKTHFTKFSSIEGYLFSPELLVKHCIYADEKQVYEKLKNKLTQYKNKSIKYFKTQNAKDITRIASFENDYDTMIADPAGNLDWIKTNIRGHDYFNSVHSKSIRYEDYVNELPESVFKNIIDFLDNIPYFLSKKF